MIKQEGEELEMHMNPSSDEGKIEINYKLRFQWTFKHQKLGNAHDTIGWLNGKLKTAIDEDTKGEVCKELIKWKAKVCILEAEEEALRLQVQKNTAEHEASAK